MTTVNPQHNQTLVRPAICREALEAARPGRPAWARG
jgi:hypothetical protein